MNRKQFLRKGSFGLGTLFTAPMLLSSCEDPPEPPPLPVVCNASPKETAGPFKIMTPADWIRANVVGDRKGVALMMNISILNTQNECKALTNVWVDIWHCDAQGNYSEYANQPQGDFSGEHFLRGRQKTDVNGSVSFISLYPGWYPGRATHIHLEVSAVDGTSLLVTEIAFPEDVSSLVYASTEYNGSPDTSNASDTKLADSLNLNLADSVLGNNTDGYVLEKTLRVPG